LAQKGGHSFDKILKIMFDFFKLDCSNYEVCKLAKHTKSHFSTSSSKSRDLFKHFHSDVWDPALITFYIGFK
jgi:hypothetical protein